MTDRMDEFLNMLVGGPWHDRAGYRVLIGEHVTGKRAIIAAQWRGWPRLVCGTEGYFYQGVWQ